MTENFRFEQCCDCILDVSLEIIFVVKLAVNWLISYQIDSFFDVALHLLDFGFGNDISGLCVVHRCVMCNDTFVDAVN